jgi:predicted nucleotidyltransferase
MGFLVRSRRAEVLEFLLNHHPRRFSINELSREAKIPVATAWNAVRDLRGLGFAVADHIGNSIRVGFNETSPAAQAFADLRLPDPHMMAFHEFQRRVKQRLPKVNVRLFGSVAKGTATPESDVDVEVTYGHTGLKKDRVMDVCARAGTEVLDQYHVVVSALVTSTPLAHL